MEEDFIYLNKVFFVQADTNGNTKGSASQKQVNFTLDLTFKNNLTAPNQNVPVRPVLISESTEQTAGAPYSAKAFHANKLTRCVKSATESNTHPWITSTKKEIPANRALRIVQTALVDKARGNNLNALNSEFVHKWNKESARDEVKILDDMTELPVNLNEDLEKMDIKLVENINNVSIDETSLVHAPYNTVVNNMQSFHVNLPVRRKNSRNSNGNLANKTAHSINGAYAFIEPMDDKAAFNEAENRDLDRTIYTTTFDNDNLGKQSS